MRSPQYLQNSSLMIEAPNELCNIFAALLIFVAKEKADQMLNAIVIGIRSTDGRVNFHAAIYC